MHPARASTPWPHARAVRWALLGAAVVLLVWQVLRWDYVADDAYIAFVHVRNVAAGHGPVYNEGQRVEGYSSPAWVALLSVAALLGASVPVAAILLGLAFGVATLVAVVRAGRDVLRLPSVAPELAAVALSTLGPWTFWVGAGLESALFGWLVLEIWIAAERLRRDGRGAGLVVGLAATIALTRPEGPLALPIAAWLVRAPLRRRERAVVLAAVAAAMVLAAHLALRLAYYGVPLATSSYAKATVGLDAAARGLAYLGGWLGAGGFGPAVPLLLAGALGRRAPGVPSLLVALGIYAAFVIAVGGDGLYQWRFVAHVAPLLAVLLVASAQRLEAVGAGVGWAALAFATWSSWSASWSFPIAAARHVESRWEAVGVAIDRGTPRGATVATNVAGKLAWTAHRDVIDLLGLCDPVVARTAGPSAGRGLAGHERAAPAYVLGRRPDVVYLSVLDDVARDDLSDLARVRLLVAGSPLGGYADMVAAPEFAASYQPGWLLLEHHARPAPVFVRRGASLEGAERREWR